MSHEDLCEAGCEHSDRAEEGKEGTDDGLQRRVRALPSVEEAIVGDMVTPDYLVAIGSPSISSNRMKIEGKAEIVTHRRGKVCTR